MAKAAVQHDSLIRTILESTEWTRDALPYTDEFDNLLQGYAEQSGEAPTKQQFWRMLSNAAKSGGWKGKKRGEPAPELSLQQEDVLRSLIAGKLGSQDGLAYTPEFAEIRSGFNSKTGLSLTDQQVWRAIGNVGKRSLRPDVEALAGQAVDSLLLGIEHFNRPSERGRQVSILLMLDHACEMLLKAAILQRSGTIRNPKTGYAHSFEYCLNLATDDGQLKFLSEDERRTLRVLNALRDQAQHYLVDVSEQMLYTVAQGTVTLVADLMARLFGRLLCNSVPERVLPISMNPPRDVNVLMDDEFNQLKKLLKKGASQPTLSEPRLRSMVTIDRALNLQEVQVTEEELAALAETVQAADDWRDVFKGIAHVQLSADGTGVAMAIHITKKGGIPVHLAQDGEVPQATIAVRKVNDTDFYCYSSTAMAKKIGVTGPRTVALIRYLKLQDDPNCFREIKIGKSRFKMYSNNALTKLREALPGVDLDVVWKQCGPKPKKPR
jgi:hypothetical protein